VTRCITFCKNYTHVAISSVTVSIPIFLCTYILEAVVIGVIYTNRQLRNVKLVKLELKTTSLITDVLFRALHVAVTVCTGQEIVKINRRTQIAATLPFIKGKLGVSRILAVPDHCGGRPKEVNACFLNSYMVYL
jgi:hypothetical protein